MDLRASKGAQKALKNQTTSLKGTNITISRGRSLNSRASSRREDSRGGWRGNKKKQKR